MNVCREKYLLGESVFEHPSCQSQAPSVHLFSKLPATISVPVYLSWRAPPLLPPGPGKDDGVALCLGQEKDSPSTAGARI